MHISIGGNIMAVNIDWLDTEHTIIVYEYRGRWAWDELYSATEKAQSLATSVNYPIYLLSIQRDEIARDYVPQNIITHFPVLARRMAPNVALHLVVLQGHTSFWRNLAHSIRGMYPRFMNYMTLVDSEAEALQVIKNHKAANALAGSS
jgi:hypothetical protein